MESSDRQGCRTSWNGNSTPRLALILLLGLHFQSCISQTKGIGDTLLDDYIKATAISNARDVSTRKMRAALDELEGRAQAHHNDLPKEFLERYRRLIDATRTVIAEQREADREKILREYVKSIAGVEPSAAELIPAAADAFIMEVSRLRLVLQKLP